MSMQSFEQLGQQARALAGGSTGKVIPIVPAQQLSAAEGEVARVMQICNACRY